jgi:hypothetical protein
MPRHAYTMYKLKLVAMSIESVTFERGFQARSPVLSEYIIILLRKRIITQMKMSEESIKADWHLQ